MPDPFWMAALEQLDGSSFVRTVTQIQIEQAPKIVFVSLGIYDLVRARRAFSCEVSFSWISSTMACATSSCSRRNPGNRVHSPWPRGGYRVGP